MNKSRLGHMLPLDLAASFQDKELTMIGWNDEQRPHSENWVQPDLYLPAIEYLTDNQKAERDIGRIPSQIFLADDYPLRPAAIKHAFLPKERNLTPHFAKKLLEKIGTVIGQFKAHKDLTFSNFWFNVTDPQNISSSATKLSVRLVPLPLGLSISVSDMSSSQPDIMNDTTLPCAPGLEEEFNPELIPANSTMGASQIVQTRLHPFPAIIDESINTPPAMDVTDNDNLQQDVDENDRADEMMEENEEEYESNSSTDKNDNNNSDLVACEEKKYLMDQMTHMTKYNEIVNEKLPDSDDDDDL